MRYTLRRSSAVGRGLPSTFQCPATLVGNTRPSQVSKIKGNTYVHFARMSLPTNAPNKRTSRLPSSLQVRVGIYGRAGEPHISHGSRGLACVLSADENKVLSHRGPCLAELRDAVSPSGTGRSAALSCTVSCLRRRLATKGLFPHVDGHARKLVARIEAWSP